MSEVAECQNMTNDLSSVDTAEPMVESEQVQQRSPIETPKKRKKKKSKPSSDGKAGKTKKRPKSERKEKKKKTESRKSFKEGNNVSVPALVEDNLDATTITSFTQPSIHSPTASPESTKKTLQSPEVPPETLEEETNNIVKQKKPTKNKKKKSTKRKSASPSKKMKKDPATDIPRFISCTSPVRTRMDGSPSAPGKPDHTVVTEASIDEKTLSLDRPTGQRRISADEIGSRNPGDIAGEKSPLVRQRSPSPMRASAQLSGNEPSLVKATKVRREPSPAKSRSVSPRRLGRLLAPFSNVRPPASPIDSEETTSSTHKVRKKVASSRRWSSPLRTRRLLTPSVLRRAPDASVSTPGEALPTAIPERRVARVLSFSDVSDRTRVRSNLHSEEAKPIHKVESSKGRDAPNSTAVKNSETKCALHPASSSSCFTEEVSRSSPSLETTKGDEEFRDKVSFAFDLCRRRMSQDSIDETEDPAFLPVMNLTFNRTRVKIFGKVARKNRDLALTKVHLYQLQFPRLQQFEALLDILQKYFGHTLRRLVLSFPSLQTKSVAAISRRFVELDELCLFGKLVDTRNDDELDESQRDVLGRLLSQVKVLVLPHMDRLPEDLYQGLSNPRCCRVESLTVKVDADFDRLVEALRTGESVRRLRLETSVKAPWLPKLLAQYEKLEELEIYLTVRESSADRLTAWMI